ncbi:MAG: rane protein, partial [Chitinophagaceae bacterium]|nr:rane protein [Chitinophagaceae bacterium]
DDFSYLFTVDSLVSLLTLTVLEVILGIDNVIFVSIIMGRIKKEDRKKARRIWMVTGICVRIALLLCLGWLVKQKGTPVFTIFDKGFDLASIVMLTGGLFLLYKTVKEIHHKLEGDEAALEANVTKTISTLSQAVVQIVLIDMIFSFDSMITAVGIAKHVPIMIIAVIIAMFVMFLFSERISNFIHKHPALKMLALSFLVLVSVVLMVEGWNSEKAHELHLKNYVYFAMAFSFGVEMLNMAFRKRIKNKAVELQEPVMKEEEK